MFFAHRPKGCSCWSFAGTRWQDYAITWWWCVAGSKVSIQESQTPRAPFWAPYLSVTAEVPDSAWVPPGVRQHMLWVVYVLYRWYVRSTTILSDWIAGRIDGNVEGEIGRTIGNVYYRCLDYCRQLLIHSVVQCDFVFTFPFDLCDFIFIFPYVWRKHIRHKKRESLMFSRTHYDWVM